MTTARRWLVCLAVAMASVGAWWMTRGGRVAPPSQGVAVRARVPVEPAVASAGERDAQPVAGAAPVAQAHRLVLRFHDERSAAVEGVAVRFHLARGVSAATPLAVASDGSGEVALELGAPGGCRWECASGHVVALTPPSDAIQAARTAVGLDIDCAHAGRLAVSGEIHVEGEVVLDVACYLHTRISGRVESDMLPPLWSNVRLCAERVLENPGKARVRVLEPEAEVELGGDGSFTFAPVRPGKKALLVNWSHRSGMICHAYGVCAVDAGEQRVVLREFVQSGSWLQAVAPEAGSSVVQLAYGQPAPGLPDGANVYGRCRVPVNTRWFVRSAQPRALRVQVEAAAFPYDEDRWSLTNEVDHGERGWLVELGAPPSRSVALRFVGFSEGPIAWSCVQEGRAPVGGQVQADRVRRGRAEVLASLSPERGYRMFAWSQQGHFAYRESAVAPGAEVEVRAERGVSLFVRGADPDALVSVAPRGWVGYRPAVGVVEADGTCRIDGLPEGVELCVGSQDRVVVLAGEVTFLDYR